MLIKAVTTLDVLSGGRMVLGLGAGVPRNVSPDEGEAGGLGIPFPSLAERFEQLEETLQIAHQMWRGDERPFVGKHYRLNRPLNSPNAIQRPHPPILVAGGGERKTLRLVARYADACNLFDIPGSPFQADLAHKLRVLRDHCRDVGRDPAEIETTTATRFDLGDDRRAGLRQLVEHLRELAAVGIDHVLLSPAQPWDDELLEAVASIVPEVHDIPTTAAA